MKKSDSNLSAPAIHTIPTWKPWQANAIVVALLLCLWPAQWLVQESGVLDSYVQRIIMLIGIRIVAAVSLQLINGISGQFSLGHAGFMAIGAYFATYPSLHYSQRLSQPFSVLSFFLAIALSVGIAVAILYGLYRLLDLTRRLFPAGPAVFGLLLLAWFLADLALAPGENVPPAYFWSWSAQHLQMLYASTLALLLPLSERLSAHLCPFMATSLSYVLLLLGGGLCASGVGLIVGFPALRLRGDYLAIATLGFAEIVRVLLETSPTLGRALGLTEIPQITNFAWIYGVAIVTTVFIWRFVHSARGRAMLAVREDEIAACSLGIDPAHSKVLAFVIGAFFAGVAGAMLAHYEGYITPANFNFMQSIELVVIVTLAGAGSISGTIVMTAVLTYLPETLRGFADLRMIIYSLLLIVMMLLRPNGILGNRELFTLSRKPQRT